jgi:RNA polymerase sigma factor (sigma-70 family)
MEFADLSDAELLARFHGERCEPSFAELIRRHGPLVLGATRRILAGSADAEDAAQVAFIALALRSKRLQLANGLGAWLHVVATRAALDMKRATARRMLREEIAHGRSRADAEAHPMARQLDEAIGALPGPMRRAVVAHYLEGSSIGEIAAASGESTGAITMRLARARELLRKKLKTLDATAIVAALSGPLRATVTREFAEASGHTALRAITAVRISEPAAEGLLRCARRVLRPTMGEFAKPALVAGLALAMAMPVVSIAMDQGKKREPAAGAAKRVVRAPVPAASPARADSAVPADPALIAAVKKYTRFEEGIKFVTVLDQFPGIDAIRDRDGRTALHWSVLTGQQDYTAILLRRGASPNAEDSRGWTPLMEAVRRGDIMQMLHLILGGANLDHVAKDGSTALELAIKRGNAKATEILLWANANPFPKDVPHELQPVTVAATCGPALERLVEDYIGQRNSPSDEAAPVPIPAFVKDPIHHAAARGDFPTLAALLGPGGGPNVRDEHGRTPLFDAIRAGQPEVAFYLLMMGADPNVTDDEGRTPLDSTMFWLGYDLDAMRYFLFIRGANPFVIRGDGHSELTWAVTRDNPPGVQFLLWLHADPRQKTARGTPFEIAVHDGSQRMIDLLRIYGIDAPIKLDGSPSWRLRQGAKLGDLEIMEAAIRDGADINSTDEDGNPAIFWALFKRNVPAAQLLLKHGVSVNVINSKTGTNLLMNTIGWDYPEMTQFREDILKAGANVNYARPSDGKTALMAAAWHVPTTPLKQLIKYGADLNARGKDGRTVLRRALDDGNLETAEFLRQQGASE